MVRLSIADLEKSLSEAPGFQGQRGSIVRLRIQNFMTYHDVEMKAGPHVNLIVGPNGTGKSTIVCAICLALAGKPKILARSTNLKEFIRHGCSTACIEVELFNPDEGKRNWTVKRILQESGNGAKSEWFLNGARATEAAIEKLMHSLNIELDNLCQFLPQDRVQDFAKMDKISLLRSTEKSIDNGDGLAETHDRLIELQGHIKRVETQLKNHEEKLRAECQHNHHLRREVKNFKDKENLKRQIEELEGKKIWLKYQKSLTEFTQLKARYDDLNVRKKAEEKLLRPLQQEIERINAGLSRYRSEMSSARSSSANLMEDLKRKCRTAVEEADHVMYRCMAELEVHENNEKDRMRRLANLKEKLAGHQRELDELNQRDDMDENQLLAELKQNEEQKKNVKMELIEIDSWIDSDDGEIRLATHRLRTVDAELNAMNEFRSSRMKYLSRNHPDTARAVNFFSDPNNVAAAGLRGQLHEPMILNVYVNDLNYGKIAEKCLPNTDLVAFYVEHKDDVKNMLDCITSNKLGKVSVIHHAMPPNFRKPETGFSSDMMRRYGFQKSVIDVLEASDYYMSYLCRTVKPQDILVGTERTDGMVNEIINNTNIRRFFTRNKGYIIGSSLYRADKNASIFHLHEASIFTDKINATEIDRLMETRRRIQEEIEELQQRLNGRQPRKNELTQTYDALHQRGKELSEKLSYRRKTEGKIQQCERMLESTEAEKQDLKQLKESLRAAKLEAQIRRDEQVKKYTDSICHLAENWFDIPVYQRCINKLQRELSGKENQLEEAQRIVHTFTGEMKTLDSQMKVAAEAYQKHKEAARAATSQNDAPEDVVNRKITEEEIDRELSSLNAQMKFIPETDPKVFQEYQVRQNKIDDMEKTKEQMERELTEYKHEMKTKRDGWIEPLKELLWRINENFGSYFARINCVGEISLDQGEDENDFSKYGVKVMVKFRTSEQLAELTGWKQSGGERAITTALYILALQELTKVPFRVIDEINQGMDAKNETRFFDLLCSLAQGPDTPQYFLLSPKMMPPVEYPDNVDFHVIFNGPHVKVDINDCINWNQAGSDASDSDEDDKSEEESSE